MGETIDYEEWRDGIVAPENLVGFFEDWPRRPSPATLVEVLSGSYCAFIARSGDGRVVGFVVAMSDGLLSAYIPLLEVLPEFRGRGIGSQLMRLVFERLEGLYMVDLSCDEELVPFYRRLGMTEMRAMGLRRPDALPTEPDRAV